VAARRRGEHPPALGPVAFCCSAWT
jgi:hypothetical protein